MLTEFQKIPTDSDVIISQLTPPEGWKVIDLMQSVVPVVDISKENVFREIIKNNLPYVANSVEKLLCALDRQLDFKVLETYISIDPDAAFHAIFLFNKDDFFSPKIQRARILAEEYLTGSDTAGIRFTFTISEDYLRYHVTTNSHKIKYVEKATC